MKAAASFLGVSAALFGGVCFARYNYPSDDNVKKEDQLVYQIVKENNVSVFSTTTCPYCVSAKKLLLAEGIPHTMIQLDKHPDSYTLMNSLFQVTNQKTVPNIFIGDQHIGGYRELRILVKENPNDLQDLLKQAQARS